MLLQYLLSCFPANFCPQKIKFARKKGHSTKERNTYSSLISFFYVMPLNLHDPASIFRSRTTVRLFSARSHSRWYRFNGSLLYLSILILSDQFIKSSLIQLYQPLFRCIPALYNLSGEKSNICSYIFWEKSGFFPRYPQSKGKGAERRPETHRNVTTKARPPREKKAIRKRVSADAFSRRASLSVRVSSYAAHFGAAVCVCRLSGCVSVDFRRELVCGGA